MRRAMEQARTEQAAQRDLAAASVQAARLEQARDRQAADLRVVELRVQAATGELRRATDAQGAAEAASDHIRASFVALLPVMLRLSQYPAESVLVVPAPSSPALQGLAILRGLAVTLNRQAGQLRNAQAAAAAATRAGAHAASLLAAERAEQVARAAALDRVVGQARGQVAAAEADGRQAALQVAQAAARTRTLREAIAAMDAETARQAAQSAPPSTARARQAAVIPPAGLALSAGQLVSPVAGTVRRAFGAPAADGPATGITYEAVPGAYVAAPCAGRVAFAAPFRSYGKLIILECAGGADLVLAGLGSIATVPGHAVRQGEPLGRMSNDVKAGLYVELRSGGRTLDPAPFLKAKS